MTAADDVADGYLFVDFNDLHRANLMCFVDGLKPSTAPPQYATSGSVNMYHLYTSTFFAAFFPKLCYRGETLSCSYLSGVDVIFRQLFACASYTYTYLLACPVTREGVLIDTVLEHNDRDLVLLQELGIKLKYLLETHIHADHCSGVEKLRAETGAAFALGQATAHSHADLLLADGEMLIFGQRRLQALATPGHTEGCTTYACGDRLFTGDTLLVRGCGRTDFQGGDAVALYNSVQQKIFGLPDNTHVYPAHDYNGNTSTTVGEEKKFNPRLKSDMTQEQFCHTMAALNLPCPKLIDIAVPYNLNVLATDVQSCV